MMNMQSMAQFTVDHIVELALEDAETIVSRRRTLLAERGAG